MRTIIASFVVHAVSTSAATSVSPASRSRYRESGFLSEELSRLLFESAMADVDETSLSIADALLSPCACQGDRLPLAATRSLGGKTHKLCKTGAATRKAQTVHGVMGNVP